MGKPITPPFRVAFPNVFRAKRNELNGKDEYSVVALFPKNADLSGLKKLAQDAIEKKFGKDKSKWPANMRNPFRDQGDRAKNVDGKESLPQGYEKGAMYLTLRSNRRPGLIDQQKNDIIDESEFYGGCWARASISAFAYDQKGNRGVSFGLGNLQKIKDGDPFGSHTKPQDDFEAVAVETDSADASAADLFT